ncbi:MAG: tandem-95 repeat protein [Leptolyngbyaceae cyanobacterium HOT.MB2.61]|nr:tandem-95 repeat protein [Leptolyngbyaceae cyanobacterium HOT.MB2.61]
MPNAGNSLGTATFINLNSTVQTFQDTVTSAANDYYRFILSNRSSFNLSLTGLSADANVALLNSAGNPLSLNGVPQSSTNTGTFSESINAVLDAGTYYIRVFPGTPTTSADYNLNVSISNHLSTDILWRNYATGQNVAWFMNGTGIEAVGSLLPVGDLNFAIQGTGDFNRDGRTDIIWRNDSTAQTVIWLMNGTGLDSVVNLDPPVAPGWQVAGTGDFNLDGNTDILWRNSVTGETSFWLMNGTSLHSTAQLNPLVDSSWQIQGVGDFNKDGKPDILWRNYSTGENVVWFMNGTNLSSVGFLFAVGDLNWRISGTGDFNRDGYADILWRNVGTGENVIWLMNGVAISGIVNLPPVDLNWRSLSPFTRTGAPIPIDVAGNSLPDAFDMGRNLTGNATYRDLVGGADPSDYYRFNLATGSNINLSLTGLNANLDLQLLDGNGGVLQSSTLGSATSESIISTLTAGTYYVRVYPANGASSTYSLNLSVNNLPVLATNNPLVVTEGNAANLTSSILRVTDNDNAATQLTYTLGTLPSRGNLILNGVTLNSGATFTQADIDDGTRLRYQHDGSETLTDSFTFTVSDGVGGVLGSSSLNIAVTPANDAPVLTVPTGTQSADQGANSTIFGISIADPDAGSGNVTVTLSAANGVLSLGSIAGLTFSQGTGSQNSSMIFSGTLAAVNNALSALIYRSNSTFQGIDTINLNVNDNGNTGVGGSLSDSKTIAVQVTPVNQPPIITLPPAPVASEDTNLAIAGISIADIDGLGGNVTVSLSAVNGVLSLNSTAGLNLLTGDGTQDRNIAFSGPLALVNAALNNLVYLGDRDFNGTDFITVNVSDSVSPGSGGVPLSDTRTLTVTVNPVNDAPVLTVPGAQMANENTNLRITGISVSDVDATSDNLTVSLSAGNGTLTLGATTGLTFSSGNGNQNASMIFSGTLAAINNALSTLTYRGNLNFNGEDTINLSVNDNGNTGSGIPLSDSQAIAVNVLGVNNAPVITVPLAPSTNAGVNLAIAGISINDPDAGSGLLQVTIAAANGVLSIPTENLTFFQGDGTLDSRITFAGSLSAINIALAGLVYRSNPNFTGFETISVSVNDQGSSGIGTPLSDTKTLFVNVGGAVNNPPIANPDAYSVLRNTTLNVPGTGVLGNDSDSDGPSLNAILVSLPAQGSLSLSPTGSFMYTPNPGFTGIDTFTYRASDGIANSNLATVTINVTVPANTPPTASPDIFLLNEDTTRTGNVLSNDTDVEDGRPAIAQLITGPTQAATFTLNADGSFNYTPNPNFNGTDTFTYIARDSAGATSNTATVTLSITPVNDLPVAVNDSFTLSSGGTLSNQNVLTNDTDIEDTRPPIAELVNGPTNALSFVLNADGSFTYVPNTGTTTDSFTYLARDSAGATSNTATVNILVSSLPNTPPTAIDDLIPAFDEDTSTTGNVLLNDTDAEDTRPGVAELVNGPTQAATFTLNADGSFSYTPNPNFNGTDTFTYLARDSAGAPSNTATVTLSITPVNDLPIAVNDLIPAFDEDTSTTGNVLSNDTDVEDGRPTIAELVNAPANAATFTLNADGSFSYTPNPNFNGTDTFTYRARDSAGAASNIATVTLSIAPVNDAPVANADGIYKVAIDTPRTIGAADGVLLNDTDPDGQTLNAVSTVTTSANRGAVVLNADGSFVYTPAAGFNGIDTFIYQATDGQLVSNLATVTLSVGPNAAPVAENDNNPRHRTAPGVPLTVNPVDSVLQNDSDSDGPSLSVVAGVTTTANGGSVTLNADGSFVYTPAAGFTGPTDTFTYRATDGIVTSNLATVTITVSNNAPPTAVDDTNELYRTTPGTPLTISAISGVLQNDTDGGDGPSLSAVATVTTSANGGNVTLNADGSFTYTPAAGFTGPTDTFIYQATDGIDVSSPATVTIAIATNIPPTAQNDTGYRAIANGTLTVGSVGSVLNNDSDGGDGPGLQALSTVTTTANGGTVTLNADGTFIYRPAPGFTNANDTFTYQVTDGVDTSAPATVTISVFTNTAPTVINDSYSTNLNTPLNVTLPGVLANDSDLESAITAILVDPTTRGSVILRSDGSFVYTPNTGFTGNDFFTYRANDGFVNSALATVSITVTPNAAPIANPDTYSVNFNNSLVVPYSFGTTTIAGVLSNDVDTDPLTASLVTGPSGGNLSFNSDGSFTYTPTVVVGGTDTFVYRASDGISSSNATVTITIKDSSAPPTATGDAYSVSANSVLSVSLAQGVLRNDTDPEGDRLSASITTQPTNGSVTLNADGSFTYTPNANFTSTDTFVYVASDGINNSAPATVTITVGAVNSPPAVTVPGSQVVFRNTELTIASGLRISDPDAGNNPVRATLSATNGSLSLSTTSGLTVIDADGDKSVVIEGSIASINTALTNLRYRPDTDYTGFDTIQITVDDLGNTGSTGGAQTGSGAIAVNVTSGAFLVKDINQNQNESGTGTLSSAPTNLSAVGDVVYFAANDGSNGTEVWRSDGTEAGTVLVADIHTALGSGSTPSNFRAVGNNLFFSANNGISGTELWKIDLTTGVASLVRNIRNGGFSSNPSNLVNFNGTLFFRADDGTGTALWRSDGTTDGTFKVGTGYSQPGSLTVVGNTLYFTASNGGQLWKTDGTTAGTVQVKNLVGTGANIQNLTAIGNTLFFINGDSSNGVELWRSDGTDAGTVRISDINPGTGSANPSNLVNLNGTLYFLANNGSTFGLYRSTEAGVVSLVQTLPSAGQVPGSLTVSGSNLFFTVDVGTAGTPNVQLWKSDGTTAGIVKDINPAGNANPASLTSVNGTLFFTANDGSTRVWRTDGTDVGTAPVSGGFAGAVPTQLTAVGSRLFFTADTAATGTELWVI